MGISRAGARLLLEEARQRPFSGRMLQLGRQRIHFDQSDMDRLAALHSVDLQRAIPPTNVFKPIDDPSCLDDGSFFSELGFHEVESLDYSSDENPTYVHDLNNLVPSILKDRFDMIYDGGTMEHVFDVRSVLRNIFEMLHVGGRIIHSSPSSNHIDHGFYMFSPTLFLDYYATNNFLIHDLQFFFYSAAHNTEPWSIHAYEAGCLDGFSMGGFDKGKMVGITISAEKTTESTCDRIPQQGMYAKRWKDHQYDPTRTLIARQPKPAWVPPPTTPKRRSIFDVLMRRPTSAPQVDNSVPNKIAEY